MATTPQGLSIDETRVRAFSERVHTAAQQMPSRLRDKSVIKYFKGKDMAYDGLETVEVVDANTRFAKLDFQDLTHNRRQILPNRWQLPIAFDGLDQVESLFDIGNEYEKHVAAAMNRKMDAVGISALTGAVNTGENFQTALTAAADGVITVDATAGFTYEKLLESRENFINNDLLIDMDMTKSYLAVSGKEHTDLMKEAELTSGDYTRQLSIDKGSMQMAAGYDLIKYAANATNPILAEVATERSCVAFTEGALCYGIQKDIEIEVRKLDDYVDTWVVLITGSFGAVRTEGKRVQIIETTI